MATPFTIGFFGAGKMATALASGFIHAELVGPKEILASDPHDASRERFAREVGSETTASNTAVLKFANVVILAVKPNHVADVLAGLKLESELMLAKELPEDIRTRAQRIKNATDRMIRMGQQLLLLARVDPEARPQDHFVRIDLCEWVRTSGAEWLARARAAHVDLQLDAPDDAVWIDADPVLLDELLGNLIDNALRYAEHATQVRLQVTSTPPTLAVEDNGCGIPPEEQGKVFEAFYRSAQAIEGGSGLGLAIVREIARAHGAWWNLLSRPSFDGTRMTVVFPGPRKGAQLTRLDRFAQLR